MISGQDLRYCQPGLYKIFWKNGECAIGIIGESGISASSSNRLSFDESIDRISHVEILEPHKPQRITGQKIKECHLGLYEIFWRFGGSSLAAIGNHHDGVRWLACCNWTNKTNENPTGRIDDAMLEKIESIELVKGMPAWKFIDEEE